MDIKKGSGNNCDIEIVEDNTLYPVRFVAKGDDGKEVVVELFFTPAAADRLGRKFINAATNSLRAWRPVQ